MRVFGAIAISVVLLAIAILAAMLGLELAPVWMVLATSVWCGWDSYERRLFIYEHGLPKNPIGVMLAVGGLWFVAFPWYLVVRQKRVEHMLRMRPGYRVEGGAGATIAL
jgi:hypothetical protein